LLKQYSSNHDNKQITEIKNELDSYKTQMIEKSNEIQDLKDQLYRKKSSGGIIDITKSISNKDKDIKEGTTRE